MFQQTIDYLASMARKLGFEEEEKIAENSLGESVAAGLGISDKRLENPSRAGSRDGERVDQKLKWKT